MATTSLTELDPVFVEVADAVYGGLLDPREVWDLAKLDGADVHVNGTLKPKKAKVRKATKPDDGHSNTARALVLGGAAEGLATYRAGQEAHKVIASPAVKEATHLGGRLKALSSGNKVGEFGLQAANLGIGLVAARKLSQNAKAKQLAKKAPPVRKPARTAKPGGNFIQRAQGKLRPVQQSMTDEQAARHTAAVGARIASGQRTIAGASLVTGLAVGHHLATRNRVAKGIGILKPVASAAPTFGAKPLVAGVRAPNIGGVGRGLGRRGAPLGPNSSAVPRPPVVKNLTWVGEISKVDADKRQVFGWCSLAEVNGKKVVDRQGDFIPLDEIEKSAYTYVIESRVGGDMHSRVHKGITTNWSAPKHTADLIESVVFTPEKLEKMGMTSTTGHLGWWVGFKVNDDEQWGLVKSGERTAFSIHGSGARTDVAM